MRNKIIFFVRHGQSQLNFSNVRQGADGPLSEMGRTQAAKAAELLATQKIDVMYASPYQRAKETADIIAARLKKKVKLCDLLVERKNPSEIIGHSLEEKDIQAIVERFERSYHDDSLRISDEENFLDLKLRAQKLTAFLESRWSNRILCVTHGVFLKMVASYMLLGDKVTATDYVKLSQLNPLHNAGIVICLYTKKLFKKGVWHILIWDNTLQRDVDWREADDILRSLGTTYQDISDIFGVRYMEA